MKKIEIKNRFTNEVIISGEYENIKDCLEKNSSAYLRSVDLRFADLHSVDLRFADLRFADLRSADLRSADLRFADLRSVDLRSAYLRSADLRSADLRSADLHSADLRSADLRFADLHSAYLRSADLRFADLRFVDLHSADLHFVEGLGTLQQQIMYNLMYNLLQLPIKGKYILYKKVNKIKNGIYSSCYDEGFKYYDGKIAKAKNPNLDVKSSCSSGIHVSTPFYWNEGDTIIAVEVPVKVKIKNKTVDNIITCLDGKIRVRQVKVVGEVELERKKATEN